MKILFTPAQCRPTPKSQRVSITLRIEQKLVKAGQQKKEELVVVSPWKRTASKKKINSTVRKQELKGNRAVTAMKARAIWQSSVSAA